MLEGADAQLLDSEGNRVAWPAQLGGDKGYRADWIDEYVLALGIKPVIPSKDNERSEHEPLVDAHRARMATEEAKKLYKRRKQTVELGFADVKQHRALRRFPRRGLQRARTHLGLAVLIHNLSEFLKVLTAMTPETSLTSAV